MGSEAATGMRSSSASMSISTMASHNDRPASRSQPGGSLVGGHEQDVVLVLPGDRGDRLDERQLGAASTLG